MSTPEPTPEPSWTPRTDLGDWLAPRLAEWMDTDTTTVTSLVPAGFEAYARVLHPIGPDGDGTRSTWAQVCAATGRTAHPLMQWEAISGTSHTKRTTTMQWHGEEPEPGNLDPAALAALLDVLDRWTAPGTDCVIALWDGFGWVSGQGAAILGGPGGTIELGPAYPAEALNGPRLHLPGRDYLLFTGPLTSAGQLGRRTPEAVADSHPDEWLWHQSPNLLWPPDHSWCVATEIDLDSTLVGGPADLVDALLASPGLEAHTVPPDGALTIAGDHINPLLGDDGSDVPQTTCRASSRHRTACGERRHGPNFWDAQSPPEPSQRAPRAKPVPHPRKRDASTARGSGPFEAGSHKSQQLSRQRSSALTSHFAPPGDLP